jgi:2-polyprenyl-3-methyl-5-hydroxy-6-metoxy-1,4-benzoquinol methylase
MAHWDQIYSTVVPPTIRASDVAARCALDHFGPVAGQRVLDLGCGVGAYSVFFASHGARVTAVDSNEVAISQLERHCAEHRIANVTPVLADAFTIGELGPFDFVFGAFILHHLEPFGEFVDVLGRSLVPGGRACFRENSSSIRTLMWVRDHLTGRWWIPKRSDGTEYPLEPEELDTLRRTFDVEVVIPDLVLARLAASYVLHGRADAAAARVDGALYRIRALRRYSYLQTVLLSRAP